MNNLLHTSPRLRLAMAILALILVPSTLLAVHEVMRREFAEARQIRAITEQTLETRQQLNQLLVMHIDAETGVRGYVLTGDEAFLQPYRAALTRRDSVLASLREHSDPFLRDEIPTLQRLSDDKLSVAALNVADVDAGRSDRARARIAVGEGKRLMDAIRRSVAELDQAEVSRLEKLTSDSGRQRNVLEKSVTAMLVGLAIVLALVTIVVGRSIRLRQEALKRAERFNERQKAMFDGAVDGMLLLDSDGVIVRMNPSVSRMFGYGEDELVGKHNLVLMEEDYSLEESRAWLASIGTAGENGAGRRQEFTGRTADGTLFETEVAISRVSGADERRYIAAIRDISHRKRAEKMKNEFVSTVSHELRTPLTSIAGSLGLLSAGAVGQLNDQAKRLVTIAHSNCERLVRLINDILDIEKIESGKMEFDLRRMQVAPLVQRTVGALRGFSDQHDVTLSVVLPPWPQCIVGDPDRLEQLLTNLVSNAIKHSPKGGEVEIFSEQAGDQVRIEVRDRGAGVPQDFRKRIFGKFAMADASDSRVKGGTGLGLSIAREIARRHGGEVGFDDRAGGGTTFHVDIPMVKTDSGQAAAKPGLPRILHLDDDHDCLSVVASAFEGKAQIVSAASLEQAREVAENTPLDGAIIDVGLDHASGLDMVPELREARPALPIVLFTAIDESHGSGSADRVLVKSRASMDELVSVTLSLVERRKEAA